MAALIIPLYNDEKTLFFNTFIFNITTFRVNALKPTIIHLWHRSNIIQQLFHGITVPGYELIDTSHIYIYYKWIFDFTLFVIMINDCF